MTAESISDRSALIRRIWEDWRARDEEGQRDKSFIYMFFKNLRDEEAAYIAQSKETLEEWLADARRSAAREKGARRRDKYTLVHALYLACESGVLSEKEYVKQFCLLRWKHAPAKAEKKSAAEMEGVRLRFEHTLLCGCVTDFFRNEGYKIIGEEEIRPPEDRHRIHRDDIALLTSWRRYATKQDGRDSGIGKLDPDVIVPSNDQGSAGGSALQDVGYRSRCLKLYIELEAEEQTGVFMPLSIDHRSGAGLWIIGADLFAVDQGPRAVHAAILSFGDLPGAVAENAEGAMTVDLTWRVDGLYDSLEDAIEDYLELIDTDGGFAGYALFHEGLRVPRGIDPVFAPCFMKPKRVPHPLTDEERKAVAAYAEEERRALKMREMSGRTEHRSDDDMSSM